LGTATVFLLMSILVEGLHEVDAVAVASRGSHPTRAKALNTTPMDVTATILLNYGSPECEAVDVDPSFTRAA
jgi:hypothetical protein